MENVINRALVAKKKIFLLGLAVVMCAIAANAQCVYPTDNVTINFKRKIPGLMETGNFSVSSTKKVYFAGGNLQYTKSTGIWKIMDHQYDMVETGNVGDDYASQDVVSLFGWGTSGWDNTATDATSVHYLPYSTCQTNHSTANNNYQYGPSNANVVGSTTAASAESWSKSASYKNYDWGVYNSSDLGSGWRTLTIEEWKYLISERTTGATVKGTSNARYTVATINTDDTSVKGLIIFPDNYTGPTSNTSDITWSTINGSSSWATSCTIAGWEALEDAGCVFLPASGYRYGQIVNYIQTDGGYWSSTSYSDIRAYFFTFTGSAISPQNYNLRYYGYSVRLVQDVPND